MLIWELLEDKPVKGNVDVEHYGIWTVEMSPKPIRMPAYTGNSAQYVAKVTDKRTGKTYIAAGKDQPSAREAAISAGMAALNQGLSDDPLKYNNYLLNFNASFSQEFHNPQASIWFRFTVENGQIFLVRANIKYVQEFGDEIKDLGFKRTIIYTAGDRSTPHLNMSLTRGELTNAGLRVNQRYTVHFEHLDSDGNELFSVYPHSRVQVRQHYERMGEPGFTISGSVHI